MTAPITRRLGVSFPWWPVIAWALVWAGTESLYLYGYDYAPVDTQFDGFVGTDEDQNMYFSFVRQSADGHWLFANRLTYLDHAPALFNLEWLAVGKVMAGLGGSARAAYSLWRAVGAAVLVFGFWSLTGAALRSEFQRRVALLLGLFGCGFGWMFLILEKSGVLPKWPEATLDLSDAIYPFGQILINPHLAVSHGLSLLFLTAFINGEQTGRTGWFIKAAVIAVVHGLIRPYDLILLTGILPLYCLLDFAVTHKFSWRKFGRRAIPWLAIAPLVGYYVYLFHFHPVFKYWASQGGVKEMPFFWHLFSFGGIGLLCLGRLVFFRRYPLRSPADRLLLVWIAGALMLVHAHKLPLFGFLPYSPVFGITLLSPMLILGMPLFDVIEKRTAGGRAPVAVGLLIAVIAINALGSGVWLMKTLYNLRSFPDHYIAVTDLDAFSWLGRHCEESDVVLSNLKTGNQMAKRVSCRLVLGHWSVTPRVTETTEEVRRLFAEEMPAAEAKAFLDRLRADWIVVRRDEQPLQPSVLPNIPGVVLEYANDDVQIFAYRPAANGSR